MPPANTSTTPKGARTQTSIFSFFNTPKKAKSKTADGSTTNSTATARSALKKDSQDEVLAQADEMMDDAMLAELEKVERRGSKKSARPTATPGGQKRKIVAAHFKDDEDDEDAGSDTSDRDNDDDGDDDYSPERGSGNASSTRRGRAVLDDDSDDEMVDAAATSSESEADVASDASSSPLAGRRAKPRTLRRGSRAGQSPSTKAPDLKRMRLSTVGTSISSDGPSLMSMLGGGRPRPPVTPTVERTASSLSALSVATPEDSKRQRASNFAKKNEERYAWLEDVRDAQGVRPGEPGYDKRTLLIPSSAWKQFSPFERQYWEIKSRHWDTLYENDASIGHQEFDLKMTDRVNMRMAGVPEHSFDYWVAKFLARGHKVARVDQMESKLAKDMRERAQKAGGQAKKGDGLVARELTGVLTAGTLVDPGLLTQDLATYCMALVEATHEDPEDDSAYATSFGVAFVDTSTAQFHMCTISCDDADRSGLETLLVQLSPREVVYVRGGAGPGQRKVVGPSALSLTKGASDSHSANCIDTSPDAWDGMAGLSQATWRTLKNSCASTTDWIAMAPRKEFWDAATTRNELGQAEYFDGGKWPASLKTASDSQPLALAAVGGLLAYLRTLKLDRDLASLGNFAFYAPMQSGSALVLDGPTLANLDIFTVLSDGGVEGTLFALLNHAHTAFGRRLLRRWMCHPLRHAEAINARLDAVDFFLSNYAVRDAMVETLGSLADLERGLSRIHAGRCRVPDFLSVLDGLQAIATMMGTLRTDAATKLPARIATLLHMFPSQVDDLLAEFTRSFDAKLATSEGRLLPFAGGDAPFDEISQQIAELDGWLDQHLRDMRKKLGCSSISYKHIGKEPYQLEMPVSVKVPDSFFRLSATKAVNRYWSPELREKVQQRAEALETKSMVLDSYQTRLYERFDRHYSLLMRAVAVVSELDCLLALATASSGLGAPACRPAILENNGDAGGFIEFRQLRHPCVALSTGADFVANDIVLGRRCAQAAAETPSDGSADDASMILLTGPNMGGKSTLLRQLCLGVILAQIGCYVPAQSATILPVDRLFTRIGARDNLLAGRSTFMVEMAETSTILRYATPRSLVVLDELGRGTSTHDGEAVAYGVLHGLCSRLGCLGIFSTHYGLLADSLLRPATAALPSPSSEASSGFKQEGTDEHAGASPRHVEPHLRPMYMACAVNEQEHRVTFLYRLQRGVASKSHGMNVAAMAGVPISIVHSANAIAERFEREVKQKQALKASSVAANGASADGKPLSTVPLTVQSDFANLLRMAALQAAAKDADAAAAGYSANDGEQSPVAGHHAARRANENQYWSCIVDHLQKTTLGASADN
ncbi:DNA mismatch repair protein msh6 [Coemansia sp. RSA 2598]|nr:DNA mismatch repair protein msh6 [Coemansia sp. RSA 2598]